jgi:hypothetical protein
MRLIIEYKGLADYFRHLNSSKKTNDAPRVVVLRLKIDSNKTLHDKFHVVVSSGGQV